jgi:hypothetical protein
MDNSFYYFFSAAPQVLAAILALFGVFVVFKIQSIKNQLIGIGQSIIDEVQSPINWRDIYLTKQMKTDAFINALKKGIHGYDIKGLQLNINLIESGFYEGHKKKYKTLSEFLDSLRKNTIIWSIFTAAIIIICLTILSQGDYFLSHPPLITITFWIIIGLILACFSGLIYILIKSLRES